MAKLVNSIFLFFVVTIISTPSHAWQLKCSVDEFTDLESCTIQRTEGGFLMMIGLTDDGQRLALTAGDFSTLYSDTFLVRVDENDARDLEQEGTLISQRRGAVFAILNSRVGEEVVQEMIEGQQIRVRLTPYRGSRQTAEFSSAGLGEVWAEFKERTGF